MQTAADPAGADWFTPASRKDETDPVRYKIRGMIGTEAMDVDFYTNENAGMRMTARGGTAALRAGLLGWANLMDGAGKPVEFDPKDWKANINRLNPVDALEIANEIWRRTFITEEARKNS